MLEEQKIIYLNGYLNAISCLNSFTNDSLIAQVAKHKRNPDLSLEGNLNQIFETDKYDINLSSVYRLPKVIKELFPKYSERFIVKIAESRNYPFRDLSKIERDEILAEEKKAIEEVSFTYSIERMIKDLITENDKTFKVEINDIKGPFYAIQHDTFIICNHERIIHIKLGITD